MSREAESVAVSDLVISGELGEDIRQVRGRAVPTQLGVLNPTWGVDVA